MRLDDHIAEIPSPFGHHMRASLAKLVTPSLRLEDGMAVGYDTPEGIERRKFYSSKEWRCIRANHLAIEPLCRMCMEAGIINDGSLTMSGHHQPDKRRRFLVVDHIKPWRGDLELAKRGPFQTLCPDHHDKAKQVEDIRGYSAKVGADGWPIDPRHPANR